ncbi:MAG: hypothetical protein ACJ76N_01265 [Thermoanaerobaculia bacterium]
MRTNFVRSLVTVSCLLVAMAPAATLFAETVQVKTVQDAVSVPDLSQSGNCAVSPLQSLSMPEKQPELPSFEPEKILTSANPCFVSCPKGGFIDCTWSWAGDPTYCCFKTSTRCQSYNCNTGAIALSKVCL